jgi:alpha-tubulin suppressor-like RCC1 family protein
VCDFACGGPCALGACQQITDVAPGGNDICASVSGRIWCLGQGGRREIDLPIFPSSVAAGLDHFCAGDVSEGLYCWGDNSRGQIGAGLGATTLFEAAKVPFPGGQSPEIFSLGAFHSCAFLKDAQAGSPLRVHCWGANDSMQSGSEQGDDVDVPTRVDNTDSAPAVWHALAVGSRHGCALLGDTRVVCWGNNTLGELGQGGTSPASSHVALEVTNPDSFTTNPRAVAVGLGFSCWLDSQGGVRCWGTSRGAGSESPVLQPTLVQGLPSKATEVVASSGHACARLEGGKVYCWGESDDGASGSLDPSTTPKEIVGLSDVTTVRTGIVNSCAILASGTVRCWGTNSHQALDSSASKTTTPTALQW